jgi:glucose-6-phosphate-specific signal transduction histidine kinase
VQDDGAGFDKRTVRGLGLLGMEERVRRLGGRFHIESQPGRGTSVSAELPLAELPLAELRVAEPKESMKQSEVHAKADSHTSG